MADITIKDVRAKYPQYSDMSDEQLAGALHQKYYADIPQEEFNKKIGLSVKAPSQPTSEPQGELSKINQTRSQNINKIMSPRGNESVAQSVVNSPGRVFDVGGQVAGGVGDIIGAVGKKIYDVAATDEAKKSHKETLEAIVKSPLGQEGVKAFQQGAGYWDKFKKSYPQEAQHIESAANYLNIIPARMGAKVGAEVVAPNVGKVAGKAATVLEKKSAEQLSQDTLNMVKRNFSNMTKGAKGEQAKATAAGLTEKKPGFFQPTTLKTTKQDVEIAKSVEGIVDQKAHVSENVDSIRKKIGELAEQTKSLPAGNEKPLNHGKLNEVLNAAKEESSVVFAGEAGMENTYNQTIKAFTDILDKKPKTLSSVLEARKEFDKLMNDKFPTWASKFQGDNVRANAIYDVRKAANDFVAGELPEGNQFKALLKQQSNMYRAAERISINAGAAGAIDPSKFQKLTSVMRKHPWVTAEAAAAAGAAGGLSAMAHYGFGSGLVNTITSPAALSALAIYGTYKIGKTVLTSQSVQKGLIQFLRATEKKLAPAEKQAVLKVVATLGQSGKASTVALGAGAAASGAGAYMHFKNKGNQESKQPQERPKANNAQISQADIDKYYEGYLKGMPTTQWPQLIDALKGSEGQ